MSRIEPRLRANLIKLFDLYTAKQGVQKTTLGVRMGRDARFYDALTGGRPFSVAAYDRTVAWFLDCWPKGLRWPAEIEKVRLDEISAEPIRKRKATPETPE